MILLYSDYETSIIYRTNNPNGDLTNIDNSNMKLLKVNTTPIEIYTNIDYRKRKTNGKFKLVFSSNNEQNIDLQIRDAANNEIVGEKTTFTLQDENIYGTTSVLVDFSTSELNGTDSHLLQVYGQGVNNTDSDVCAKIHRAEIYYY